MAVERGAPVRSSEILGYPPEARVLIVNCDDFGMHEAIDVAVIDSIDRGVAGSCSLMTPCPSAQHALRLLRGRPDIPFGIHLTLVRDSVHQRWGPMSARRRVPSLLTETGELFTAAGRAELLARARPEHVEREFRAQIEAVTEAGLSPTHLDFHCLADGGREDILDLTVALAAEYGTAVRVWLEPGRRKMRRRGLPVVDNDFLDSFSIDLAGKPARYARLLRELPAGLNEWAVHPSTGGEESRTTDPAWRVRRTDYEFLTSPEARELLRAEDIVVIDYSAIQQAWSRPPPEIVVDHGVRACIMAGMPMDPELVPVDDPEVGGWIGPRFDDDFGSVGATVPQGYAAYARVLHPVDLADGRPHLTWAEICRRTGHLAHPLMQWHAISAGEHGRWDDGAPFEGNLDPTTLETLLGVLTRATGDQDCFHALWEGWGWVDGKGVAVMVAADGPGPRPEPPEVEPGVSPDVGDLPRLSLPGRDYLLFRGPLRAATKMGWRTGMGHFMPQSPSLLWPADRSWCVATEIDFDSTLVAGPAALVAAVLDAPGLEAWPVEPGDHLTYDADLLNGGRPTPRRASRRRSRRSTRP